VFWIAFACGADLGLATDNKNVKISIVMENTVPTIFLLIEYPLNMIPVNIRQLPIDLAVYLVWGVVSVVYEMITLLPLYGPMSWRRDPGKAFGIYFAGFCVEILFFFVLWILTEWVKLPRYMKRQERKTEHLALGLTDSSTSSFA
jgi:hypothetical protein